MILFEASLEIPVGPMQHAAPELHPDRPGIGVVAVRRDPIGDHASDGLCWLKETIASGQVLTENHVDQGAIAIDRAVEVLTTAVYPKIRLVEIPATADFALSASAKFLRQCRREL
jgi:hypothetical protein